MKKRTAYAFALTAGAGLSILSVKPSLADHISVSPLGGLQLSIASETTLTNAGNVALTIRYFGGSIHSIQLYVDGNLLEKTALTTSSKSGNIRFEIDPALVSPGTHLVVVKAKDAYGQEVVAKTTVRFGEGGPVRLTAPLQNAIVQGVVPIEVQLDPALSGAFVSFYVDNQFLMMKNYAPYTFNWDSTRVPNGPHDIYVEVLDAQTQAVVKRIHTLVTVNNVAGFTTRQNSIPDLHASSQGPASPQKLVNKAAEAALAVNPESRIEVPELLTNGALPAHTAPIDSMRAALVPERHEASKPQLAVPSPRMLETPALPHPGVSSPDHEMPTVHFALPAASAFHPGVLAMLAEPHNMLRLNKTGLAFAQRLEPLVAPKRIGNFAVLPRVAVSMGVATHPRALTGLVATPVVKRMRAVKFAGPGATAHTAKTLQIAFDNQQIAFDVPPRIEHGLPLAPFRQIFEHTGGVIEWYSQSKTVRAINTSRQIEFRIGEKNATVNDQSVKMQVAPAIVRGRAIVPLSFVKEALNVKIQYDPQTGHVLIQSR